MRYSGFFGCSVMIAKSEYVKGLPLLLFPFDAGDGCDTRTEGAGLSGTSDAVLQVDDVADDAVGRDIGVGGVVRVSRDSECKDSDLESVSTMSSLMEVVSFLSSVGGF